MATGSKRRRRSRGVTKHHHREELMNKLRRHVSELIFVIFTAWFTSMSITIVLKELNMYFVLNATVTNNSKTFGMKMGASGKS